MSDEVRLAVEKLSKAVQSLSEGVARAKDDLERDGVIQRFEFMFELLWKALKIYLKHEGVDVKTPREALKAAFRVGLIKDEDVCLDMLEDRNRLSHIYSRSESEKIFGRVRANYLDFLRTALAALESKSLGGR